MRIVALALRSVLAVAVTVALALSTGLAAAQNLSESAQDSDNDAQTTTSEAQTTANTSSDGWQASDATAFKDFSDETITAASGKINRNVFVMVDGQFVSGATNGNIDGSWTEGVGPQSNGDVPNGVFVTDYMGADKVMVDRTDAVDDTFLDTLKDSYLGTMGVGGPDKVDRWSTAKTNLKGDSFEGLYVYYKSQLRTRLAWAGNIDGDTWVVPWDDSKSQSEQCNPSNKTSDKNKCFMTKLAEGAYLTVSFFSSGSRIVNYGSAVSAGNAIGLKTDTNGNAQNAAGTILNREHTDNRATILRYDEKVRPGRDMSFNVQLSHGGTYLRVFLKDSDNANVSACPADADVTSTSNVAFVAKDTTNRVYSEAIPGGDSAQPSDISVKTNESDPKVKTVTIKGTRTSSTQKYLGVCVQEVYWHTTTNYGDNNQQQTVRFSSQAARPNTSDIQNKRARGGMYIKTFTNSRLQTTTVSGGTGYYPSDNDNIDASKFTFNSCSSSVRTSASTAHWRNAYDRGHCSESYLWVTSNANGIPANGALTGDGDTNNYVNPDTTFFEQLRYGDSNYGDDINTADGTNVKSLAGEAGSKTSYKTKVAKSEVVDRADYNNYPTNTASWTSEYLTAKVTKSTYRGSTVSFLVMDTMRSSEGNEKWGTTESPTNLAICATTTTTTTANCQNVKVSNLEFAAAPKSDSYTDQSTFSGQAWQVSGASSATLRSQAEKEIEYYKTSHTNTITLTKGALKGTRVKLTFLPAFYRDGTSGYGGDRTNTTNVRSIHPLLVTVENVTTNLDMHLNWTKNSQTFLNLGDASGLEDLQIARNKYYEPDGYSRYVTDRFRWTSYSSTFISTQWNDYTDQLDEDGALVIRFKIATGYRISKLRYGEVNSSDRYYMQLESTSWKAFQSDSSHFSKAEDYDGETYYKYSGTTKLSSSNACMRGDTDGYFYCRIKPTSTSKTYVFSFEGISTVTYTAKYAADNSDKLTVGNQVGQVDSSSIETREKSYNTVEFAGGLQVTASRPAIKAAVGESPSKFFLYWKVYIKRSNGALVAVRAGTGDSKDDRDGGDGTTLVVYPGQKVEVSKYYAQMPTDTVGVVLKARWTSTTEYEAVTRQVTAWGQTYDANASKPYGWSATVGSGASAVTLRQETYMVLIPASEASSSSSYASTYPAYEGTSKQNGKGFLPKSASVNYVSDGAGGWAERNNTSYTLVSDEKCSAIATAETAGAGSDEYCNRNDLKLKLSANAANPGVSSPSAVSSGTYGSGQMMVGYYRVELQDSEKVSYKTNVCAAGDTAKTDCGYDYDSNSNDTLTANVDNSWLFRGHYLFDNTRVPTTGSANMELPWIRLKAGSTQANAYQWLFNYWSLRNTRDDATGKQEPTANTTASMPGMVIGWVSNLAKNVLDVGTLYYAQWENNSTPAFSIRTEKTDESDLDSGAVFQLFMWEGATANSEPTEDDLIERNADGTGVAKATTNGVWRPVIQHLSDYVSVPTAAQVTSGTAGEATQVTTSELMSHTGVAQWRGISNGYNETGKKLTDEDYEKSSDEAKRQAYEKAQNGEITLPTAANFEGKIFALIQVKAPSSNYICNSGQWMFKISDYVSGVDSTIGSPAFAGTLGDNSNSVYTWGVVGGTQISTAGTVHAIKESVPLAGTGNWANVAVYKRVAAVVNIDSFDLPTAGWRVPMLLMAAGLMLTFSSWAAYGFNNRRRAYAIARVRARSRVRARVRARARAHAHAAVARVRSQARAFGRHIRRF